MKRITLGLLSGILFLTACGQSPSTIQSAPTPVVELATSTPSPLPTSTQTASIISTEVLEIDSCLPKPIQLVRSEGNHIGLRTPPELHGIKNLDALLIQSGDEFSIGLNLMLEGQDQYLFWLEKFCDSQNGQRFTEVIDEIILLPLKEGEFAITTCE